ncbi:MAG: DUF3859 domain-containing protein [Pseudomonadota bacterium]
MIGPRHVLAGLVCLMLTHEASAQVRLIEAGIVCPRETSGELVPAPNTESGVIRQIDRETSFDLNAREVPTIDLLSFGFRTTLKDGVGPQEVAIVVTHPPMGERAVTRQEWVDVLAPGETNLNLFTFEEEYEKVPGPWAFSVEVDGEAVVTVPFMVVADGGRSAVEATCFQFMS